MDKTDVSELMELIDAVLPEVIELRHDFHRNPELSLQEHRTAERIREALSETDIDLLPPLLQTDVVGILRGEGSGRNVTLRADIDALPVQEETGSPYASQNDGVMHACGHDGHTAILIGAARVLDQLSGEFDGSVRFVFQPGEEIVAAGKALVEKGVLCDPEPDAVFALHGWPNLPVGAIAAKGGVVMAAADFFRVTVKGLGAHGCMPHKAIDPIVTSARIVDDLKQLMKDLDQPDRPVVISVCQFSAGSNQNVIPGEAEFAGTVRYLEPGQQETVKAAMEECMRRRCEETGASYDFEYTGSYIPTVNDDKVVELARDTVQNEMSDGEWVELDAPSMGGEDFAYYIVKYPGAMFRLGTGAYSANLHNPKFDFNDDAIRNGILFMVSVTLRVLAQGVK